MRRPVTLSKLLSALPLLLIAVSAQGARGDDVKFAGYVMVPMQTMRHKAVLAADVNSRKATMFVDTGAFVSMLDENFARRSDLKYPGDKRVPPNTPKTIASGQNRWRVGWVSTLRVGGLDLGARAMAIDSFGGRNSGAVVGSRPANSAFSTSFDGLIGNDILFQYGAIIDCLHNRIYFKTDRAKRTRLASVAASAGYVDFPLLKVGQHLYVSAAIGRQQFSLLVDTGTFATLLSAGIMRSFNVELTPRAGHIAGFYARSGIYALTSNSLSIGDFPLAHPQTIVATDLPDVLPASVAGLKLLGLLGMDSLAYHAALIDFGERKLYLRKAVEAVRR